MLRAFLIAWVLVAALAAGGVLLLMDRRPQIAFDERGASWQGATTGSVSAVRRSAGSGSGEAKVARRSTTPPRLAEAEGGSSAPAAPVEAQTPTPPVQKLAANPAPTPSASSPSSGSTAPRAKTARSPEAPNAPKIADATAPSKAEADPKPSAPKVAEAETPNGSVWVNPGEPLPTRVEAEKSTANGRPEVPSDTAAANNTVAANDPIAKPEPQLKPAPADVAAPAAAEKRQGEAGDRAISAEKASPKQARSRPVSTKTASVADEDPGSKGPAPTSRAGDKSSGGSGARVAAVEDPPARDMTPVPTVRPAKKPEAGQGRRSLQARARIEVEAPRRAAAVVTPRSPAAGSGDFFRQAFGQRSRLAAAGVNNRTEQARKQSRGNAQEASIRRGARVAGSYVETVEPGQPIYVRRRVQSLEQLLDEFSNSGAEFLHERISPRGPGYVVERTTRRGGQYFYDWTTRPGPY